MQNNADRNKKNFAKPGRIIRSNIDKVFLESILVFLLERWRKQWFAIKASSQLHIEHISGRILWIKIPSEILLKVELTKV